MGNEQARCTVLATMYDMHYTEKLHNFCHGCATAHSMNLLYNRLLQTWLYYALYHRRRNRGGGSGGTCPHKLQVGGAVPPQPKPCQDAVLGLTMIHSMNIDSSRVYST